MRSAASGPVALAAMVVCVALSGCFGGCGPTVEGVHWVDPDFAAALAVADLDGWTVTVNGPGAGAPTQNETLLAWNAALLEVQRDLRPQDAGAHARLRLHHAGTLSLVHDGADAEAARDAVDAFLAQVTGGNETERAAWTDALLESGRPGADGSPWYGLDHEPTWWTFETPLPRSRLALDEALRVVPLDRPETHPSVDGWGLRLEFPEVWAQRGSETFLARADDNEYYGDWPRGAGEGEAVTRFQAAYLSLGLGEPPEVEVIVVVC